MSVWGIVKWQEAVFHAPTFIREFGFRCWARVVWKCLSGRKPKLLEEVFSDFAKKN